jgi:hypothetical protein
MLQADIVALEHRQQFLERQIVEALRNTQSNNPFINDLKSRALFVREQIEILRQQANASYH